MLRNTGAHFQPNQQQINNIAAEATYQQVSPTSAAAHCFDFFERFLVDRAKEGQMRQRRQTVIDFLNHAVRQIIDTKVQEFKKIRGINESWFDLLESVPMERKDLYSENEGEVKS